MSTAIRLPPASQRQPEPDLFGHAFSLAAIYGIVARAGTLTAANYIFQFVNGTLAVLPPPATGASTLGLFAPSPSAFFLDEKSAAGSSVVVFNYGAAGTGWMPISGDWTGSRTTTIGLYDPARSIFFLHNSNSSGIADITFGYGPAAAGWIPITGDWTGDGITSVGLYDPATSTFYLRNSNSSGYADITFGFGPGGAGWIPITGNWTGTRITYVGLFDPHDSMFYLRNSNSSGYADTMFNYGPAGLGWQPLAGHWTGNGPATVGLYNPATSTFYLRFQYRRHCRRHDQLWHARQFDDPLGRKLERRDLRAGSRAAATVRSLDTTTGAATDLGPAR